MAATQIRKWGNSAALRLSTATLEEAHFAIDQEVSIQVSPGRIVIEAATPVYELEAMIASVTRKNRPDFVAQDPPVGAEVIEW
jgi:antitoxin MazE